jgi:hypothetical protein
MEDNIRRVQAHLDRHGIGTGPHQDAQGPAIGRMRLAAGAGGSSARRSARSRCSPITASLRRPPHVQHSRPREARPPDGRRPPRRAPDGRARQRGRQRAASRKAGARHGRTSLRHRVRHRRRPNGVQTPQAAFGLAQTVAKLPTWTSGPRDVPEPRSRHAGLLRPRAPSCSSGRASRSDRVRRRLRPSSASRDSRC